MIKLCRREVIFLDIVKFQIKIKSEQEDLSAMQKYLDLGWTAHSKFELSKDVYMVNLVWQHDSPAILP